jgi:alanine-glyoxylate transaminase/serine-glyoxylate transaminase/serine-pyruvate transaminase
MPERDLLMIPGPTMVDPAVLRAMSAPVISMSAPQFLEIFGSALQGVRTVLGGQSGQAYVIAGSGHLALEFGVANLVEAGDRVLLIDTGFFASRYRLICERYEAQLTAVTAAIGDVVPLDGIESELKQAADAGRPYKVVHVVHVDTSTDVAVDVAEIGRLAHRYGALMSVDGVCAAAGMEVNCDAWDVDMYLTGSQKAFGVPPGLAICWASDRALDAVRKRRKPVHNFFCDALNWLPMMQSMERRQVGFFATPPITLICGLHESLKQILAETMPKRIRRHKVMSAAFKAGVEGMGLRLVPVRREIAADTLTCAYLPKGIDGDFVQRVGPLGVTITRGILQTDPPYFRVGHMGTCMPNDILATLGAIEQALIRLEHDMQPGAGLSAAMKVLVES